MTPEMNWLNIEIGHVKPNCSLDISNNEGLNGAFCWKNIQPLSEKDHQYKGTDFKFLDYQLQIIRAYQFIKLED